MGQVRSSTRFWNLIKIKNNFEGNKNSNNNYKLSQQVKSKKRKNFECPSNNTK